MPARNNYICVNGHIFEHIRKQGEKAPTTCRMSFPHEGMCEEDIEIYWDCIPGEYFGTMGLIDRL